MRAYKELNASYSLTRQLTDDPELIATLDEIERVDRESLSPVERKILAAIEREESAEAEALYLRSICKPAQTSSSYLTG